MGDAIGAVVKRQTDELKQALRADTASASPGLARVQKSWRGAYFRNDPTKGEFPAGAVWVKGALFEAFQEEQTIRPAGNGLLWIITEDGRKLLGRRGAGGRFSSVRSLSRLMDFLESRDIQSFVRRGAGGSRVMFANLTRRGKEKLVPVAIGVRQVRARKLLKSNEIIERAQAQWAGEVAAALAQAFPTEGGG